MQLFNKSKLKKGTVPERIKVSKAQSLLKNPSSNILTLFVLITLGLQGLIFFQLIINILWTAKLANRPAPTLVELADGRSIRVEALDSEDRTPLAIKTFTSEIVTKLFSASGKLAADPNDKDKRAKQDLGITLQGKGFSSGSKVTTPAWEASFALDEEFRSTFLQELAQITPAGIFTGTTQSVLSISYLSEPELIEPGKWKLNMIANLFIFQLGDKLGQVIPINKTIYVKAVYVIAQPLKTDSTDMEKTIFLARGAGLEIYRFGDVQQTPLTTEPSPTPSSKKPNPKSN